MRPLSEGIESLSAVALITTHFHSICNLSTGHVRKFTHHRCQRPVPRASVGRVRPNGSGRAPIGARYDVAIGFTHLILSPGHAVWKLHGDPLSDNSWYLRPYQRGEPRFYVEHIRRAVELTAADPDALLIFSGCYAPREVGPLNEAAGYWMLAEHHGWWGRPDVRARSTIEDFALDSFHNLLYSICRFREFTGEYPRRITVPGWGFKTRRFTEVHRAAIRFRADRFDYAAVNEPGDLAAAEEKEAATRAAFIADPYGSFGDLDAKRRERDPLRRQHGYGASCPEIAELLKHRGPEIFAGRLPWD